MLNSQYGNIEGIVLYCIVCFIDCTFGTKSYGIHKLSFNFPLRGIQKIYHMKQINMIIRETWKVFMRNVNSVHGKGQSQLCFKTC